jgi:hypothetical protein
LAARCNNGNGRENGEKSEKLFSLDVLGVSWRSSFLAKIAKHV